ncbi:unnamed protein product [Staurois parvus]|uniref:Uncharacterized protein n=1 Tax=Staurois parvus TaxID=386267 RepID=A0ABN9GME4_9NEOB|nr:unnamed protein product [Staurois parvus]
MGHISSIDRNVMDHISSIDGNVIDNVCIVDGNVVLGAEVQSLEAEQGIVWIGLSLAQAQKIVP